MLLLLLLLMMMMMMAEDEQIEVELDRSYPVECIVTGGNPPPAVNLSSGVMPSVPFHGVEVALMTADRDPIDRMSDPFYIVRASMTWTATISNIGTPLNCMSGVENPVAVWTSFVPIVADSKLYILRLHNASAYWPLSAPWTQEVTYFLTI